MLVSIIIPTRNRKNTLSQTLASLFAQSFKGDYEIIIVDGGSTDGTIEMLTEVSKNSNVPLRYYRQKTRGMAEARNMGIENAKGDIVLFTDDDCVPEEKWIQKHIEWYKWDKNITGVSGLQIARYPTLLDMVDYYEQRKTYIDRKIVENPRVVGANNVSYPRSILVKLGGFDKTFTTEQGRGIEEEERSLIFRFKKFLHGRGIGGEDSDVSQRAALEGRVILDPSIEVYHLKVNSFTRTIVIDWFHRGMGAYVFNRKHGYFHIYQFLVPFYTIGRTALFMLKLKGTTVKEKLALPVLFFLRQLVTDAGYLAKAATEMI
jgi:glycosyltransferase involved in cell wall biosynthesis